MRIEDLDGVKLEIPELAKGTIVPDSVITLELREAKEKRLRKEQWRHDFRIALFGVIGGGIMGLIASIIYDVATKGWPSQ